MTAAQLTRCEWCGEDPVYRAYHDDEWGVPLHDERALFEQLCLEGQQAGLSWITVLKKRNHYRKRFHHFNIFTTLNISSSPNTFRHTER